MLIWQITNRASPSSNLSCLHETTIKIGDNVRVYLPSPPGQLVLFELVKLLCLHETTLNIGAIVRVYLPSPPSQLTLFELDNF